MKKKRSFHCQTCGCACEVYKKGKKHRVLVCPKCGVLATNPFSFGRTASGALLGAEIGSIVPGVGTAVGAGVGGVIGSLTGRKSKKQDSTERFVEHVSHRYGLGERVHDALR